MTAQVCELLASSPLNIALLLYSVALLLDYLRDALGRLAAWIAGKTGRASLPK